MELEKKNTDLEQLPDSVSIPIAYGTVSFWQGKKQSEEFTHKWMVFVRSPDETIDLSTVIEKVVFVLHESFKDNERVITKPPFEVHEKGWGEFDMVIRIIFKKPFNKEPLEFMHHLGLYHNNQTQNQNIKKPVVSEFYEEVVFVNPSVDFYNQAQNKLEPEYWENFKKQQEESKEGKEKQEYRNNYTVFNSEDHTSKLGDALSVVQMEVERLQGVMKSKDKDLQDLYKQINEYSIKTPGNMNHINLNQQRMQMQQHQQQQQSQQQNYNNNNNNNNNNPNYNQQQNQNHYNNQRNNNNNPDQNNNNNPQQQYNRGGNIQGDNNQNNQQQGNPQQQQRGPPQQQYSQRGAPPPSSGGDPSLPQQQPYNNRA